MKIVARSASLASLLRLPASCWRFGRCVRASPSHPVVTQTTSTWWPSLAIQGKELHNQDKELHNVYARPGTIGEYHTRDRSPDGTVLVKEVYETSMAPMTT